jgi:hypothetical protein
MYAMASGRMTFDERDQWRRLFAMAEKLERLDPWPWMGAADCFGIAVPGWEEPCFVAFGGQSQSLHSVRFLLGWKAMFDLFSRLADPAKQVDAWLLEIRMIELLFVNRPLLFEHEVALLKRLRRSADDGSVTPILRSLVPGYHPWVPDARERALLEVALYQAYGMAMRVESDGMLLKSRFPSHVLIRKPQAGGLWRDVWTKAKEIGDEEVDVRIEAARVESLGRRPLRPVTLQLDLVFTPLRVHPEGIRPQTAYVLLAVDAATGFIVTGELFQATEGIANMWAQIPERLLELFERQGGCPAAIEIGSDRMANLLRPLSELLPFKMVRRERLAALEKAREHMSAFLASQGD